jgi:hypothetical protein
MTGDRRGFPRRFLALAGWAVLAGCASSPPRESPLPPPPPRADRSEEIVLLYNGEPVTWGAVAGKLLELNLRGSVDHYLRWRVVEDRRRQLGVANAPEDLRRRAEAVVRDARRQMTEDRFQTQLRSGGTTESEYVARLAASRELDETLTREKILRYLEISEETLEIDRMVFSDEGDARRFAEACRDGGFDRAAEAVAGPALQGRAVRRPREVFPRSAPPHEPVLDPWIVEALASLRPGQTTGAEASRSGLFYVVRLHERRPGKKAAYSDVREEVMESVLRDPPRPEAYEGWIARELARNRVELRAPGRR